MKKLALLSLLLLLAPALFAQLTTQSTWRPAETPANNAGKDFMLAFQVGVPSREMRPAIHNRMGDVGIGGELLFLSDPFTWGKNKRESALRLGGGMGYTYYGHFKTPVPGANYNERVKTSYGLGSLKAIGRFRPDLDRGIHPFADVQAGLDLYLSSTQDDLNAVESGIGVEPADWGSTSSASFSKGIGGGLAIGSRDPEKARVVLRVTYNWGTRIKYIVRNSMEYDASTNTLYYETARAPVRYILFQVGIGL